jgi:hypothetical protein
MAGISNNRKQNHFVTNLSRVALRLPCLRRSHVPAVARRRPRGVTGSWRPRRRCRFSYTGAGRRVRSPPRSSPRAPPPALHRLRCPALAPVPSRSILLPPHPAQPAFVNLRVLSPAHPRHACWPLSAGRGCVSGVR